MDIKSYFVSRGENTNGGATLHNLLHKFPPEAPHLLFLFFCFMEEHKGKMNLEYSTTFPLTCTDT